MSVIEIRIFVPELSSVLALFDYIQVQRSVSGPPLYSDAAFITADDATSATVTGSVIQPYPGLQGLQLKLKVDQGVEQAVTFTAINPVSLPNVITQINSTITGLVASNNSGHLKLTNASEGTISVIEITNGSANTVLGFSAGQKVNGQDENVQLLTGVSSYTYFDRSGLATNYYRTRYYQSLDGSYSAWSDWVLGSTGTAIGSGYLISGRINLADIDGTALVGRKVTIVNVYHPLIKDSYFIAGRSKTMETDGTGQAQTLLVKESVVDVIVEGTSVIRRISVPSTGTEFDLLDPSLQTDDPFGIQLPDLPAAVRGS